MHLKSLTLRGFKSFASASTLRFEPGITCVVGPNGAGKSNIVDALAWVMGEQGAKSLRGGKMEDVVFAGTASRAPLGRAEVSLTIDNSDGALPIDYAEVTISRLLFRSGHSEYAINGDHCRLLDISELLSDSGLGREMHVVVGQGQLDDVLHAGPEARRALIEEAAGVLKHRKRKEKAVRKLEAMQGNLTRLEDLSKELGRQLKPLGRQAEIARKAATIQAELRDARLRLLADDYVTLAAELERERAGEAAVTTRRAELDAELTRARGEEAELEAAGREHAPRLAQAQETWFSLAALAERFRGIASLAAERHHHLSARPEPDRPGRDPSQMEAEAAALREEESALATKLALAQDRLAEAVLQRSDAEAALAEAERQLAASAREAAARAERLAKLRGQVGAARSRGAAAQEEITRLAEAETQARARAEQAEREHGPIAELVAGREEGRADLAAAQERTAAALAEVSQRVTALRAAAHAASDERSALQARKEALEESLNRGTDASAALLGEPGRFRGVLGSFATMLTVREGAQQAIAAALGAAADAVAVAGLDEAVAILGVLRGAGSGRAGLVIADAATLRRPAGGLAAERRGALPPGALPALDLVRAPDAAAAALAALLGDVVVAGSLDQARDLVRAEPRLRVVTTEGDLVGTHWAQGGSGQAPSLIETRAAADEAAAGLAAAQERCGRAEVELAAAVADEERARQAAAQTLATMQEVDAAAAEISGRLGLLAGAARAAREEAERLAAALTSAQRAAEAGLTHFEELERRLAKAEAEAEEEDARGPAGSAATDTEILAQGCSAARAAEMDCRLEVRTLEERVRAITGRAGSLAKAAAAERQARERASARLALRRRQAAVAAAVAEGARRAIERIEQSVDIARAQRQAAEEASAGRAERLTAVRARGAELSTELEALTSRAHSAEIVAAEHRMRLEQLAGRAAEEYGVDSGTLVAEYGPEVPVLAASPEAPGTAYDRAGTERRAQRAERQLAQLGKVNPLALEEFAALQERHAFLGKQIDDLKKTRRDLLTVIKEVDDRVQQVFEAAYRDTAREFEDIFSRLFPGGQGRLVLTEPGDMLTTGIEVEARPPGKRVKRLSLLSGGERSLTAIALLVAIFKARPSPFYVLDEVEAALDDINLQRLLHIFEELRQASQLIVITHQKRTMEVADSLYGVTMRGDGVSTVVSQRLREREPA